MLFSTDDTAGVNFSYLVPSWRLFRRFEQRIILEKLNIFVSLPVCPLLEVVLIGGNFQEKTLKRVACSINFKSNPPSWLSHGCDALKAHKADAFQTPTLNLKNAPESTFFGGA